VNANGSDSHTKKNTKKSGWRAAALGLMPAYRAQALKISASWGQALKTHASWGQALKNHASRGQALKTHASRGQALKIHAA